MCGSEHTVIGNVGSLSLKASVSQCPCLNNLSFTTVPSVPLTAHFKKNRLLSSLPTTEWKRWSESFETVEMPLGQVLYEPGVALNYVYFPLTSIVSLLYVMENPINLRW